MKISIIGAGSSFTYPILRDIFKRKKDEDLHICFMDLREGPLEELKRSMEVLNTYNQQNVSYSTTTELPKALDGADHVVATFAIDFPYSLLRTSQVLRYHGLDFTEGETATPGALMATMRHLPPLIKLANDVLKHCPKAWLHITSNPMPRIIDGIRKATGMQNIVGHCHGTFGIMEQFNTLTGVPTEHIDLHVCGINHFHLVQRVTDSRTGEDLLKRLESMSDSEIPEDYLENFTTTWLTYRDLGYYLGHGHIHNYDYLPYANKRMFLKKFDLMTTWPDRLMVKIPSENSKERQNFRSGESVKDQQEAKDFMETHTVDDIYAIASALSGVREPYRWFSANLPNDGHLPNCPEGAIIELPGWVKPNKLEMDMPEKPLPTFFESWVNTQLAIHRLSVDATLEQSRQKAIEAIALDPCFRDMNCSPATLLDNMLKVNEGLVPTLH